MQNKLVPCPKLRNPLGFLEENMAGMYGYPSSVLTKIEIVWTGKNDFPLENLDKRS